jgi:DNA repair exonuclease SbcCD nuclease subunit
MSDEHRNGAAAAGAATHLATATDGIPPAGLLVAHSSDLHIDDAHAAHWPGGDALYPLRQVVAAARRAGADLLLLAGDVFEHNRLPQALVDAAARLLAEAECPVVLLPGNHDPLTPDSPYRRGVAEPPHVHVLGLPAPAVAFPRWELEVWGRAHVDYADMAPLHEPPARRARWRIAMAHGHYQPTAPAGRLRPSWLLHDADLVAADADYIALGHWNRPARVGGAGVCAYYSGSPELARSINLVRLLAGPPAVSRLPLDWHLP